MDPRTALNKLHDNFEAWAKGEGGARSNPEDFADMQHDLFREAYPWITKHLPAKELHCRRPYCAVPFEGESAANDRTVHEAKETPLHLQHGMDYICTDPGHAVAIEEEGMCPVCQ